RGGGSRGPFRGGQPEEHGATPLPNLPHKGGGEPALFVVRGRGRPDQANCDLRSWFRRIRSYRLTPLCPNLPRTSKPRSPPSSEPAWSRAAPSCSLTKSGLASSPVCAPSPSLASRGVLAGTPSPRAKRLATGQNIRSTVSAG